MLSTRADGGAAAWHIRDGEVWNWQDNGEVSARSTFGSYLAHNWVIPHKWVPIIGETTRQVKQNRSCLPKYRAGLGDGIGLAIRT